jgi:hypothetical protein
MSAADFASLADTAADGAAALAGAPDAGGATLAGAADGLDPELLQAPTSTAMVASATKPDVLIPRTSNSSYFASASIPPGYHRLR